MTEIPNLLRPNQLENQTEEATRLEHTLKQPDVQDRPMVMRQLRAIKEDIERRTPTPFPSTEIDMMVQRERELRDMMVADGMPTQEEMRRNPPGSTHKHIRWEQKHKKNLQVWKYIAQRLSAGANDPDASNFEKFRPRGGPGELNMDNAQIPKTTDYFFPADPSSTVVIDDEAKEKIKALDELDPGDPISSKLALLTNEQRAKLMQLAEHLATNPSMDLSFEEDKAEPKMKKGTATLPKPVREATSKRMVAQRQLGRAKKKLEKAMTPEEVEEAESLLAQREQEVQEMMDLEQKVKEAHT